MCIKKFQKINDISDSSLGYWHLTNTFMLEIVPYFHTLRPIKVLGFVLLKKTLFHVKILFIDVFRKYNISFKIQVCSLSGVEKKYHTENNRHPTNTHRIHFPFKYRGDWSNYRNEKNSQLKDMDIYILQFRVSWKNQT